MTAALPRRTRVNHSARGEEDQQGQGRLPPHGDGDEHQVDVQQRAEVEQGRDVPTPPVTV